MPITFVGDSGLPALELAVRIVGVVVAFGVAAGWGWFAMRRRGGAPWLGMGASLAAPWLVPAVWIWPRVAVTVLSITMALKLWMLARGGALDPRMTATPGRFLFWFSMPPESRWPSNATQNRVTRRRGLQRVGRGVAKLVPIAALLWIEYRWPAIHDGPWRESAWALWVTWLGMSTLTDVVSGLGMLSGIEVAESFDTPPLARSPRDFWSRRWNLYIAGFIARFGFRQVGGRRHPLRATAIVFLCSGLGHELFIVACMGRLGAHTGWMLAFFALHGAAVMAEMIVRRRWRWELPRALAIALHFVWLLATAPLFFRPLGEIF